jgi:tetratricopeptide (TPR) repeat protein
MTEAVAAIQGRRLDSRYTLLDKLGAGGQGEVWRAHDEIRGIDIALKVLNPALARNDTAWAALEHEYAIASRLDHPCILKVFPPERSGDVMVLPMELASGGDLRRLRGAGYLEIIPVLLEIAQALEHAHESGVVHRDLKPGNILFDSRGRARLADFGVAETAGIAADVKSAPAADGARDSSRHGFSPFTASPAQLRGEPPSASDDIYGLGALAYELLSGYPPYYPHFDRKRAIAGPVPALVPTRQIPPLLNQLVTRMLLKEPAKRPGCMRDVIDDLDAALNDTLTFDFEEVSGATSTREDEPSLVAPAKRVAAVAPAKPVAAVAPAKPVAAVAPAKPVAAVAPAAPPLEQEAPRLPSMFVADEPAANMSEGPNEPREWTAGGGLDRRATPDRRAKKRNADTNSAYARTGFMPTASSFTDAELTSGRANAGSAQRVPEKVVPRTRADAVSSSIAATSTTRARAPAALQEGGSNKLPATPVVIATPSVAVPTPVAPAAPVPRSSRMWPDIPLEHVPRLANLEPIPVRRWPWVVLGLLAGAAAVIFFLLPHFDLQVLPAELTSWLPFNQTTDAAATPDSLASTETASVPTTIATDPSVTAGHTVASAAVPAAAIAPAGIGVSPSQEDRLGTMRQKIVARLAMLESRGAGVWGGRDFASAKARAAESVSAHDAGNSSLALERVVAAGKLLDAVESRAPQALTAQIVAGEKALGTGQQEVAGQAFDLARRIDPNDRRVTDGQRRAHNLNGVLPLLADADNAETGHDYARAAQDYSQALSLDPGNPTALAGQARANASFGDDNYAKAVGSGFAALGAGRLDEAHTAFAKARALKPNGSEASEGLRRVGAALTARGFASMRQRAAGLEAQERWSEAEQSYDDVLNADPQLAFAQEGKARAGSRAELAGRLQAFIDQPQQLASPAVRDEARSLLDTAQAQSPSGPVLRSQIARLQILLPGFDKPVHLSLLSDNSTVVAIASVGSFGAFARREVVLRPGKYTVVGTRNGFRDVRREITVAPGQETQTIRVTCSEPI